MPAFTARAVLTCVALSIALLLSGCGTSSNLAKYSQAQLTAITTREVDAGYDATFKAALDALFDSGYTITTSDKSGGIITGAKGIDQSSARFWVSPSIQDTRLRLSVLLQSMEATRTSVRVSMSKNDVPYVDEKAVDGFWKLMQRQVMMKQPPPSDSSHEGTTTKR